MITINDGKREALELGANMTVKKLLYYVRKIDAQFNGPCTREQAKVACGWVHGPGDISRVLHSGVAVGFMTETSGLYSVTLLFKRLLLRDNLEEAAKDWVAVLDTTYAVLTTTVWQDLEREDLVKTYEMRGVSDVQARVTSYLTLRPYWAAARAGNVDELTRLLDTDLATVPARRPRSTRRVTFDDHKADMSRSVAAPSHVTPIIAPAAAPTVSAVPAVQHAVSDTATVDCTGCSGTGLHPDCHGTGKVVVRIR